MKHCEVEKEFQKYSKKVLLPLWKEIDDKGKYDEFYQLFDEGVIELNRKFSKSSEALPHFDLVLFSEDEMVTFVMEAIQNQWNEQQMEDDFDTDEYAKDFQQFITNETSRKKIIDYFSNNYHLNFDKFLKNFFSDEHIVIFTQPDRLLSFWIVKIHNQYLVQAAYYHTDIMDFAWLLRKIKTVLSHGNLTGEAVSTLFNISKDILVRLASIHYGDKRKYMETEMDELHSLMDANPKLKKYADLSNLHTAFILKENLQDGDFKNIYQVDLKREIDLDFIKQFNYSKALTFARNLLVNDYTKKYSEKLTDYERVLIYYILFKIMYHQKQYKTAIQFGEYLLEDNRLEKSADKIFERYPGTLPPNFEEQDSLIKRYDTNFKHEYGMIMLEAYVKEGLYDKALTFMKSYAYATSYLVHSFLNRDKEEENINEIELNIIEEGLLDDISLLLFDYYAVQTGMSKDAIIKKWKSKYQDKNYVEVVIKPIAKHFRHMIMIAFYGKEYKLTAKLIDNYCTYFIEEEDAFIELKNFILRFSNDDKFLIHKEILKSLRKGEILLEQHHNEQLKSSVSDVVYQVKTTYLNAGKLVNEALLNEKKRVLFNLLEQKLDDEQVELIYDDLSKKFEEILDAKSINNEKLDYHEQKMVDTTNFGEAWYKLHSITRKNILNGLVIYDELSSLDFDDTESIDYSPAILCWCRALENEIVEKMYHPYRIYCEKNELEPYCFSKKSQIRDRFMLGSFWILVGTVDPNKEMKKNKQLQFEEGQAIFTKYAADKLFNIENEDKIKAYLENINKKIRDITKKFRNRSAHPGDLDKTIAEDCYDYIFPTQNVLIDLAKKYK